MLSRLKPVLPDDFEIVLADVGAAGGLKRNWAGVKEFVTPLFFEPREDGAVSAEGRGRSYPVGLAATPGERELHVTALANMSSLLTPNAPLLGAFRKKPLHAEIRRSLTITVDTLDNIAKTDGLSIDALKVDTQGTELEILEGASKSLAGDILLAEVEVSFLERYCGQALFADIAAFMSAKGFELLDLNRLKRYRYANRAGVGNVSLGGGLRPGRLAYGDAIFFLSEDSLRERLEGAGQDGRGRAALKAIILLMIYGKADLAARRFDALAPMLETPTKSHLARLLAKLGRAQYGPRGLHLVLEYLARQL